jgi:hypothetical protein
MKIATLGLDLSIASTGIAHIASDGAVRAGKVTTKPSTKGKQPQSVLFSDADRRIAVIRDSIVQHLVLGASSPPPSSTSSRPS